MSKKSVPPDVLREDRDVKFEKKCEVSFVPTDDSGATANGTVVVT